MPEADWWLCDACQSLNNLSARKCYSCRRRKPKRWQRASQYLGYVPVITWDKRVRFDDPPTLATEVEEKHLEARKRPPPLREPVTRHITAVAPPDGVRMTYRAIGPPAPPHRRPTGPAPDSPLARVVPGGPYPPVDPRSHAGSPLGRLVAIPIETGPPPRPSQPPRVAIPVESDSRPDDPGPGAVPVTTGWAHWRDLLDVPAAPDADRLRRALASPAHRGRRGDALEWPAEDLSGKRDSPPG